MSDERDESQENESGFNAKSELEALREQLAEMNQQYQANMQSIVDTITTQSQAKYQPQEDPYMTEEEKRIKMLESKISDLETSGAKRTQDMIRRERELDNTVVRLASQYPEIQADASVQKAVVSEHNKLNKSLQDTAEGYELAVQRAVSKLGLVPKSKRQQAESGDDYMASGKKSGGSATVKKGKTKVDEKTLAFASLLGRDINDPKVLEGLEKASERQKWLKYQ